MYCSLLTSLYAVNVLRTIYLTSIFQSVRPNSKTFWRIARSGSTEDFESAPYVVTLLSSSLWVYYGITKPGGLLVATVNGVGVVMEAVYVTLFLLFATPQLRVRTYVREECLPLRMLTIALD